MLEKITVDGFRSLNDFSITLRPGLNIIVGSNGTGKSNFIVFLDFLSKLLTGGDLNSAIAVAQGAGSMFSKEKFSTTGAVINFRIDGKYVPQKRWAPQIFSSNKDGKDPSGTYQYLCSISYQPELPAVFISSEEVTLKLDGQKKAWKVKRHTSLNMDNHFVTRVSFEPKNSKLSAWVSRFLSSNQKDEIDIERLLENQLTPELSMLSPAVHGSVSAHD